MAQQGFPVYDYSPKGIIDDGTENGAINTRLISSNLLLLPAVKVDINTVGGLGAASVSRRNNYWENIDGSNSAITASSNGYGQCAVINATIFGKTVGIYFRTSTSVSQLSQPFTVAIDGNAEYYIGEDKIFRYNKNRLVAGQFRDNFVILDDNLPDTEHTVEVILPGDPSGNKSLIVYGFIVDNKPSYNYSTLKRTDQLIPGGKLTASLANVNLTSNSGYDSLGIKKIIYRNTDTVTRTVTIAYNLATTQPWIKQLTAGETWVAEFSDNGVSLASPTQSGTIALQHMADVAGVVESFILVA